MSTARLRTLAARARSRGRTRATRRREAYRHLGAIIAHSTSHCVASHARYTSLAAAVSYCHGMTRCGTRSRARACRRHNARARARRCRARSWQLIPPRRHQRRAPHFARIIAVGSMTTMSTVGSWARAATSRSELSTLLPPFRSSTRCALRCRTICFRRSLLACLRRCRTIFACYARRRHFGYSPLIRLP